MGDQIRVERQTVFVGTGVIILDGREIDDHDILRADVAIGMPDMARHIDEPRAGGREIDFRNLAASRGIGPRIIHHEFQFALDDEIAVLMELVKAPALDEPGPDREHIGIDERFRMPVPTRIIKLGDAATLIGMAEHIMKGRTMRQGNDLVPRGNGGLLVLDGGGKGQIKKRTGTHAKKTQEPTREERTIFPIVARRREEIKTGEP